MSMKFLYLWLFILFFVHCSNDLQFDRHSLDDRFSSELSSEHDDLNISCENEEDCTVTETFLMDESQAAVDIVFVLDVSSSMKNNLKKLGSSMLDLLAHIQDFDWQMAFTTADHGDHTKTGEYVGQQRWEDYRGDQPHFGQFMNLEYRNKILNEKILNKQNKFYDTIFYDTLTINSQNPCSFPPFCQGDHEQPLRALKAVIEREENRDFFRPHSDLITIIITNEDERVEDQENATTAEEVVQAFQSQFSDEKNLYGFGILIQEEDKKCYRTQKRGHSVEYGKVVSELAKKTYGKNISICSSDYGKALTNISQVIRNLVLDNVYLKTAFPSVHSLDVEITPQQNVQWKLEGRHIVFKPALKLGSKVKVTYLPR